MWMPHFACPECGRVLDGGAPVRCRCGQEYSLSNGVHRFLTEPRRLAAQAFARQYRHVRQADGHRDVTAVCWPELPRLPETHAAAGEWRIRRESYEHLLGSVLAGGRRRILDLGAGSGWLSSRLATRGHDLVALDRWDDEGDKVALGAHQGPPFVGVEADFEALPFEPAQFDVVVFNASLHYAGNPEQALGAAARMLQEAGALVVMDSPMFAAAADGEAMVAAHAATLSISCGLPHVLRSGLGYLTFDALDSVAERLGRHARFLPSRGPLTWRARRSLARFRLGRSPAAFGVWVA